VDGLGFYCRFGGLGGAVLNEDSFEHEGINYHAIERETCIGCSFEKYSFCHLFDDQPYCMSAMRMDNRNVVWQKQESKNG
jgi:hypothetical protein